MLGTEPRAFSRPGIGCAKEPHLVKEPSSWTLDPGPPLLMMKFQKPLGAGSQGRLPGGGYSLHLNVSKEQRSSKVVVTVDNGKAFLSDPSTNVDSVYRQ